MISYQPDATSPLNPANRDILPRHERITTYPCDWSGCPNDAHAPGALCDACQAEADAAAPSNDQPINTPNTMNSTDNFDALKDNFFKSIREARTKHVINGMCTVKTTDEYWPARVNVMQPTNGSATVSINVSLLSSCGTKMDADELRQHAAHCLAAAEEIDAAKAEAVAVRPEPATAA